jgi:hypothetical protein
LSSTAPPEGTLKTKSQNYILRSTGTGKSLTKALVTEEGRQPTGDTGAVDSMLMDLGEEGDGGGEGEGAKEMGGGMRLLVPRIKAGGKLFIGKSITNLVLAMRLTDDSPDTNNSAFNPSAITSCIYSSSNNSYRRQRPTPSFILVDFHTITYDFSGRRNGGFIDSNWSET